MTFKIHAHHKLFSYGVSRILVIGSDSECPSTIKIQRQEDNCKFKASLIYIESTRLAEATWGDPVSKMNKQNAKGCKRHYA